MSFLLILFFECIICARICEEGKNNCLRCDYINQLCIKCDKDIYSPDRNGGCSKAMKCIVGKNYCQECNDELGLCKKCEEGYFPDENGGCSYTDNCEISERGECIKCKDDYIKIGENTYLFEGLIICKSIYSPDFKNCEDINLRRGICNKCKEGYYLTKIDNRCVETENCLESYFGKCVQCSYDNNYYLDKKDNKCKKKDGTFINCKETIDGKSCEQCYNGYYFDEKGKCTDINFCSESGMNGRCDKCISGYYLASSYYKPGCTKDKNCNEAGKDSGLCLSCNENYYLDYNDGKCKSNLEDNEFKYCKSARGACNQCIFYYYLGEDLKCSPTKGCLESNNGICNVCSEGYYLGLDNKCSLIERCIYSTDEHTCKECEENYYYEVKNRTCVLAENEYKNCKKVNSYDNHCSSCKNNFYLNKTDNLCYSNEEFGPFYKCSYTDYSGQICVSCIEDYYYSYDNNICSKFEGCSALKDENTCIECDEYYCLDSKNGSCVNNYDIIYQDKLFYFGCIKTNAESTACEICVANLTLKDGLCVDEIHCKEEKDGVCVECQTFEDDFAYHCFNHIFGCVETGIENCLECNDLSDFYICTKCMDGYKLDIFGDCVKIEEK